MVGLAVWNRQTIQTVLKIETSSGRKEEKLVQMACMRMNSVFKMHVYQVTIHSYYQELHVLCFTDAHTS